MIQPEMKKPRFSRNPTASVLLIIASCSYSLFIVIIILSVHKLPQPDIITTNSSSEEAAAAAGIGKFGKMMIDMLPDDLPFTVFLPSEEAFSQQLKLKVNESLLSRVLGFSVVPRAIYAAGVVGFGKEMDFDSLCGFRLGIWKEEDGRLLVNGVTSRTEDCRVGAIVVHVMDGVIMDAEFEQSFREDDDEED